MSNPEFGDSATQEPMYQGQFGTFTITPADRRGVYVYRGALTLGAIVFALGVTIILTQGIAFSALQEVTLCYGVLWLCLGVALATIHIYLVLLHRVLQLFWAIGGLASLTLALTQADPLALYAYQHTPGLVAVGFTFAALTGIFFKEGFCFDRLETKLLTPLVPGLLLGHWFNLIPKPWEPRLLILWAIAFGVFSLRKWFQDAASDIGDKSVFEYLKSQATTRQP